jgi:hypothetical protein
MTSKKLHSFAGASRVMPPPITLQRASGIVAGRRPKHKGASARWRLKEVWSKAAA